MTNRVFVSRVHGTGREDLDSALAWFGIDRLVRPGDRVFLKPNLTWPEPTAGVTTTPAFIAQVAEAFLDLTPHVTIGEANGGYHSFEAEAAFEQHGLYDLSRRTGVRVVNLSRDRTVSVSTTIAGESVTVELPATLLEGTDIFVTLPVPKMHVMTRVSLGFKNQWGCQPGTMRLRNHPDFDHKVLAINALVRARYALYDGTYFLDKTGPMVGDPVRMDLLIAAEGIGAGDLACCDIMGVNPWKSRHLRLARKAGLMPSAMTAVETNACLDGFRTHRFTLERSVINYLALMAFRSHVGTRVVYDSRLADPLHSVLYRIRRNRLIGRLLYGPIGPPAAQGTPTPDGPPRHT